MAGASPLSLGAAEARDTIAELEGEFHPAQVRDQDAFFYKLSYSFCVSDYINGLVVKHNKKFASDETLAQSQDGEEPEYKQQ